MSHIVFSAVLVIYFISEDLADALRVLSSILLGFHIFMPDLTAVLRNLSGYLSIISKSVQPNIQRRNFTVKICHAPFLHYIFDRSNETMNNYLTVGHTFYMETTSDEGDDIFSDINFYGGVAVFNNASVPLKNDLTVTADVHMNIS